MQEYWYRIIAFSTVFVFLGLVVGSSLTHRPQIDEGMFADPAYNLALNGQFGTTVLEKDKSSLTRIEERTYWVMPLFLLNVAASFKAFGFSLFSMRLVSVFWGLALIAAIYLIVLKTSGDKGTALFALALVACDYVVLETASSGRMDMMSAALGFSALTAYLFLREKNLSIAVLLSQSLIVLDGLTHPNAIMACAGLLILTLYFDFRRLTFGIVLLASVPYLTGGLAFGLWVWQDPTAFKDQFIDNAMMGGRMSGLSSPLGNIVREFTERYPHAYGLQATSGGHSGPIWLKSLSLIAYAVGIIGVLLIKELRRNKNYIVLLILTAVYFLTMSLLDGQKETPYLVHIVPFYLIFLASMLGWMWQKSSLPKIVLIGASAAIMLVPAAGMALRISQNTYGKFYKPMIAHLQANASDSEIVMGGAEVGFGFGFRSNLVADGRFGFYTGKRPKFIIYDSAVDISWRDSKLFFPAFYEYFPRLLSEEYRVVYENSAYKIYERK